MPRREGPPFEGLYQLLLALYGGALGLLLVLRALPSGEAATPQAVRHVYGLAWPAILVGGLLAPWGLSALRRRAFAQQPAFYAYACGALHLALLLALRVPLESGHWCSLALLSAGFWGAVALLALRFARATEAQAAQADRVVLGAAPPLALLLLRWIHGPFDWHWRYTLAALALAAALLWAMERGPRLGARARWALGALALALGAVLLFPWRPGHDVYHQNFFVGPVQALLQGDLMYVRTRCQYGIAIINALAAAFWAAGLPPSFHGLTALTSLLYLPFFLLLWLSGLRQLRSLALGALGLLVLVASYRFGYWGEAWDPALYPSVGPLRFGLPLLSLLAAGWRRRRAGRTRAAEWAFAGVASIWSLEAAAYTAVAYGVLLALEAWQEAQWRNALRALGGALLAAALSHALLNLLTFIAKGQGVDYGTYLAYFRIYDQGAGFQAAEPRHPWFLLGVLAFAPLAAGLILIRRGARGWQPALAGALGLLGVLQFSYYLFRPHLSNLRFIGVPSLLACLLLLDLAWERRALPDGMRRGAVLALGFLGGLAISLALPTIWDRLPDGALSPEVDGARGWGPAWQALQHPAAISAKAREAAGLNARFRPGQREASFFFDPREEVEAHLLGGTVDPNGIAAPEQDILVRATVIPDQALAPGDIVIVAKDSGTITGLSWERYQFLTRRFRLKPLECGPQGVCAARLEAL